MDELPERPEWLWDPDTTLMFEDERQQAQNYIEHLEKVNKNLRESARILKEMAQDH